MLMWMQSASRSIRQPGYLNCKAKPILDFGLAEGGCLKSKIQNRAVRFDIITIFPEIFRGIFEFGIIRRAVEAGLIEIQLHDLRDYTFDRHHQVDDRPFGGGAGMVM